MPKSKKPPAKGTEGKPAAVKPGVSKPPPPKAAVLSPTPKAAVPPKTAVVPGKPASGKAVPSDKNAKAAPGAKGAPVGKPSGSAKPSGMKLVGSGKPGVAGKDPKSTGASKNGVSKMGTGLKAPKPTLAKGAKVIEPPQPAEPRKWPKGGPTKSELKHYRDRLLEMRRALLLSSKELAAEALKSSGADFSVDHMADHGSDNYEQDFSLKLLEGESQQLADIREALMKIDGKVETPFGICEACADEDQKLCETCPWITPSRLEVLPHARLCVQTKEIEERRRQ
jgi:DnaK suppressor protein